MRLLTVWTLLVVVLVLVAACATPQVAAPVQAPQPTATQPPPPPTATQPPKDLLATIKERGYMVMSTDPNYAPQSFLNEKGEMEGFDIDVAKEVARRLGVDLKFVTPDWDLITSGNWGGRWDISIGSMTITPERAKVLYFTQPYYYTPAQFAVHEENTTFERVEDLSGKRIGVCGACTYEFYLDKTLVIEGETIEFLVDDAQIVTYDTDADAIQDLALGDGVRLDAVLSALPTLVEAQKSGVPIKLLGDPVFYEPLAVAIDRAAPQDPTSFVEAVDKIIGEMHADGTLTKLSMKWYGVDLTKKKEVKPESMLQLLIGEAVSAVLKQ